MGTGIKTIWIRIFFPYGALNFKTGETGRSFLKNICIEKSFDTTVNMGHGWYLDEKLTGLDELGGDHMPPFLRAVLHPVGHVSKNYCELNGFEIKIFFYDAFFCSKHWSLLSDDGQVEQRLKIKERKRGKNLRYLLSKKICWIIAFFGVTCSWVCLI